MTETDKKTLLPTLTPVPQDDFNAVSRNVSRIGTAVVRIESAVGTIKDDLLPPVARAASEARDGVMKLDGRVTAIEDKPEQEHECVERGRQNRQDNDIAETRTNAANIIRLVWWMLGIAVIVGGSAVGFTIAMKTSTTENSTRIESHMDDLSRHEREIEELRKAQERDRETYLREMRELPSKVQNITQEQPNIEAMEKAADDLPLNPNEQRQFIKLLKTAKARRNDR